MPGIPLNLPIPTLSDTQTQVVTKVAQALTAIETDLTPQVTPSEININTDMQFNGNKAVNVNSIEFTNGTNNVPGALYYDGADWFVVTPIGTIQLTQGGTINVAGTGGIGGDYVSASALVTFDNTVNKYKFFGAGAVNPSDLEFRNLVLKGTNANVTVGVSNNLLANKTINVESVPAFGIGLLAYDGATNTLIDGTAVPITRGHTFSSFQAFNSDIFVGGLLKHNTWTVEVPLTTGTESSSNIAIQVGAGITGASAGTWTWSSVPLNSLGIRSTDRLTSFTVNHTKTTGGTTTVALGKRVFPSNTVSTIISFISTTPISPGDFPCTIVPAVSVVDRERYFISYTAPTQNDILRGITLNFDNP